MTCLLVLSFSRFASGSLPSASTREA
jgi:hypothetical protein